MRKYNLIDYIYIEIFDKNIIKNIYRLCSPIRWYLFFFRVSYLLVRNNLKIFKVLGILINKILNYMSGTDIDYSAEIDIGFLPMHLPGIVIRPNIKIGKNFKIHQNTTLGLKEINDSQMIVEDNVTLGANVVIIGGVKIGENSYIGALTFINCDIPKNSVVYNKKEVVINERV